MAQLRDGATHPDPAPLDLSDKEGGGGRVYWYAWPKHFDYVLIQRYAAAAGPLPVALSLVAHSPNLDLYRVR
jgi:hypothetical protein